MHKRFFKYFFNNITKLNLRYSYFCLCFALLLTLISTFFVCQLSLDSSLTNLLPDSFESVRNSKKVLKETGGTDQFIILIRGEGSETIFSYASILKERLLLNHEIKHAYFTKDMEFFYKNAISYTALNKLESMEKKLKKYIAKKKIRKSPFFFNIKKDISSDAFQELDKFLENVYITPEKKYYYDQENNTLAMIVVPFGTANDISLTREIYALLLKVIASTNPQKISSNLKIDIGGSFKNKIDEYETIISDIRSTAALVIIAVVIVLALYFRNIFAILFIVIPLSISILWTFAIARVFIGNLNTFTGFLFVILFGLGVDFGVHLFSRYAESRRRLFTIAISIKTMFRSSGKASMTSAFTTAFVFFSLTLTNFKGFSEFGFIAGTGVLMAMSGYFIVLPALLILAEKFHLLNFERIRRHAPDLFFLGRLPFSKNLLKIIFASLIAFSLLSLYGLYRLEFDYDFTELRANLPASTKVKENIGRIFPESFSPAVFISKSIEEVDLLRDYFDRKIKSDHASPTIEGIRTVRDIAPEGQNEKRRVAERILKILQKTVIPQLKSEHTHGSREKLKKIRKFLPYLRVQDSVRIADVPQQHRQKFLGAGSTGYLSYVIPSVQLRHGKNAIAFANDVTGIQIGNSRMSGGGSFVVFAEMLVVMLKNGKLAIILSFVSVFLVLLFDFRTLLRVAIVTAPLVTGIIWLSFVMLTAGIKLNFYNIIVIPSIIGIGVDNGVHLFHRFLEEKGRNLRNIFVNTGGAIFMTSLTTVIGFSGLAFATHGGLSSIGKFAILGISICFASTICIMPIIFYLIRKEHHSEEVLSE